MRRLAQRAVCCLLWVGAAAWAQEQAVLREPTLPEQASFVLRRQVAEVGVQLAVTDRHGKAVSGIRADDLLVLDNGQPVSSIFRFIPNDQLPLRIAVAIDWSDSMRREFDFEHDSAGDFFRTVLRTDRDQAMVVGFRSKVEVTQGLTNNIDKLQQAIRPVGGAPLTSLYDAVVTACRALEAEEPSGPEKRVLLLLSDGLDNYSLTAPNQTVEAAQRANIAIYAIAQRRSLRSEGERALTNLTAETGGRLVFVSKHGKAGFQSMEEELRSGYALSFKVPVPATGAYHSLEVRTRDRNLQVRVRRAYYTGASR